MNLHSRVKTETETHTHARRPTDGYRHSYVLYVVLENVLDMKRRYDLCQRMKRLTKTHILQKGMQAYVSVCMHFVITF